MPLPTTTGVSSVKQSIAYWNAKVTPNITDKVAKAVPWKSAPAPHATAKLPFKTVFNGPAAKSIAHAPVTQSLNARINQLFGQVRQQEKSLQDSVAPAQVTSCKQLPAATGQSAAQIIRDNCNPLDCVIKHVNSTTSGKVVVFNPADSRNIAGGLGVGQFKHSSIPFEETLALVGTGMKASLDQAKGGYPLGQEYAAQNQLYSRGIALRHNTQQLAQLAAVQGSGRARLDAQRDLMLSFGAPTAAASAPRFDMVSIAGFDRRDKLKVDMVEVANGLHRQLAQGFESAKRAGARTVVLPLPGTGLFSKFSKQPGSKQDPAYLQAIAYATARAIHSHGKDLRIIIPSHGAALDGLLSQQLAAVKVAPTPPAPQPAHNQQVSNSHYAPTASIAPSVKPVAPKGSEQYHVSKSLQTALPVSSNPPSSMAPAKGQVFPVGSAPKAVKPGILQLGRMGEVRYFREPGKVQLNDASPVRGALGALLGDGSKVSVHRVHGLQAPTAGSQRYWFIGRDPDPTKGRALVSVQVSPYRREVFEVTFNRAALPDLARKSGFASPL